MVAPNPQVRVAPSGPLALDDREVWLDYNIGSSFENQLGDITLSVSPIAFGSLSGTPLAGSLWGQLPLPEVPEGFTATIVDVDLKVAFSGDVPATSMAISLIGFIHDDSFEGPTAKQVMQLDKTVDGTTAKGVHDFSLEDFTVTNPFLEIPANQALTLYCNLNTAGGYPATLWVYRYRVKVKFTKL